MSEAKKHTPGPWVVGDRMNIEAPDPFCGRVIVANAAKSSGIIPDNEREANAHLIAAAPDYDAAARAIVADAEAVVDMPDHRVRSYIITKEQMDALRAAIARATGAE